MRDVCAPLARAFPDPLLCAIVWALWPKGISGLIVVLAPLIIFRCAIAPSVFTIAYLGFLEAAGRTIE